MTREQYHLLAPTFNLRQQQIEQAIARIPLNVNRAGKHYQKLVREIKYMKPELTPELLKKRVDRIIEQISDPEMAHSDEDDLHREIIASFCPPWVQKEINRLSEADFPRWCA